MSLISNGINSIRAFALPGGIWADGCSVTLPRVAFVQWRSVLQEVYYQIYVNGRFAGTTVDTEQWQMIVPIPSSLRCAVRIEVFAVQTQDADMDFSDELDDSYSDSGRVKISMLRSHDLPSGATAQVYFDNGSGEIDYDNPLTDSPIYLW